jgi:hypothetical protein
MARLILNCEGVGLVMRELGRDIVMIGRAPLNQIVIDHPTVSAQHAALRLLHGDVECGVDGEVELVECAANMDRMASGPERCQHQIDPGIDGG